jgi:putative phage-type endonuclease
MLTEKQKTERRSGIGGSDAAVVCGLSRFKTPYDLYLEKTSELDPDDSDNKETENEKIYFGNLLEDIVANEYARRTGNKVAVEENVLRNKNYPWMLANIDRLIKNKKGVLECKTSDALFTRLWGESYTDNFPDEYLLQCAHYAIVLDVEFVDLAVLIGGNNFRIYTYKRNYELEKKLIEKEKQFWHNNVLPRIPPDPITSDEASKIWNNSKKEAVMATMEVKQTVNDLTIIKKQIDELMKQKEEKELLIKSTLKDKEELEDEYGNLLLSWRSQEAKRFDLKTFQKTHSGLYEEFLKISQSRVLRIRG